jgi:glyoxylase-like metal-dependent hydrolase (beta-lactamase superfamily II)
MRRTIGFLLYLPIIAFAQASQPDGAGVRPGTVPASWKPSGPICDASVPNWQVHEYNENFYIIRESGCTNYEKPFLYLIFGNDRALLEDTGAGKPDTYDFVSGLIDKWCQAHQRAAIPLLVAHSHSHSDHVAGDGTFAGKPNVTVVPLTVEATQEAFHMAHWPDSAGQMDLGGRVLDVIAIPGHDKLSIAFYDRLTGVLLTGDSLYPGRLYVSDFPEFARSTQRLVEFTRGKIIAQVLGTHIEQTATPYLDYPIRTVYQPDEHPLALSRGTLLELNDALIQMQSRPARMALRDITIWPREPRKPTQ